MERTINTHLVGLKCLNLMTISTRLQNMPLSSFLHVGAVLFYTAPRTTQAFLSTDYIGSCLRGLLTAFAKVRRRLQARLQGLQYLSHRRSAASPASPPAAAFSRHSRLHTIHTVA